MGNLRRAAGAQGNLQVSVDGVELAYEVGGPAPDQADVVILGLHAAGHGSRDFELLRERLDEKTCLVTFDWPSHGRSGPDHVSPDARRYADLALGFCEALDLPKAVVLGNSVGGAAAILLAANHPDRVTGLVLANSGGLAEPGPTVDRFCTFMANRFEAGARGSATFGPFFSSLYRVLLRGQHAAPQRRRIVAAGPELAPVMAELWRSFATPANDVQEELASLTVPTLLTWARSDPFNGLSRVKTALDQLEGARLVTFPGGHTPFLEDPDSFAGELSEFSHEAWRGSLGEGPEWT